MPKYILNSLDPVLEFNLWGGGKAGNMAKLTQNGFLVPKWFCISSLAYLEFLDANHLKGSLQVDPALKASSQELEKWSAQLAAHFLSSPVPEHLVKAIESEIEKMQLRNDQFVAVRSSGIDEDSADHSFAGQFSTYLFQKGRPQIMESLLKCWASGFSMRALSYRMERGLPLTDIHTGVIIQLMVDAEVSGVAFSRDPIRILDRDSLLISSVFGAGEGLVSGELDADHFRVHRHTLEVTATVTEKAHTFVRSPDGGLKKTEVRTEKQNQSSLTEQQIKKIALMTLDLERKLGSPQDCEWGIESDHLYCLQTRPITNLPPAAFFDPKINGSKPILWDNSNVIESYNGVTSPLTFSIGSSAYRRAYLQFHEAMGVSKEVIQAYEESFRNLLGFIRGRVYYNLVNWYQLLCLLPGAENNKKLMETMMGVKQQLKPEVAHLLNVRIYPYSPFKKLAVLLTFVIRFFRLDRTISKFHSEFSQVYNQARKVNFRQLSLSEQLEYYYTFDRRIFEVWKGPVANDFFCMFFFGLLKKLNHKWVIPSLDLKEDEAGSASLQNALLCGDGGLESAEPTKMLMRIAAEINRGNPETLAWFTQTRTDEVWTQMSRDGKAPEVYSQFLEFLDRYGFRCMNELKLEESDLHDNPVTLLEAVTTYLLRKNFSIEAMEQRESMIRNDAENRVKAKISKPKQAIYFWTLRHSRKMLRNRENLRFSRTKIYGILRRIFRSMGENFHQLGVIKDSRDIFYLTFDEISAYIEGRSPAIQLSKMIADRKDEFERYRKTPSPPERFLTYGAVGATCNYIQVLTDSDLLRHTDNSEMSDPGLLKGTPCCPGIVEGIVRVAYQLKDAEGLNGEILVTTQTDPGWIPFFPSCSALLIERGSPLSHSATVAREFGIPTIVGISGGLTKVLKSGQRVRVDGSKGEVRILA